MAALRPHDLAPGTSRRRSRGSRSTRSRRACRRGPVLSIQVWTRSTWFCALIRPTYRYFPPTVKETSEPPFGRLRRRVVRGGRLEEALRRRPDLHRPLVDGLDLRLRCGRGAGRGASGSGHVPGVRAADDLDRALLDRCGPHAPRLDDLVARHLHARGRRVVVDAGREAADVEGRPRQGRVSAPDRTGTILPVPEYSIDRTSLAPRALVAAWSVPASSRAHAPDAAVERANIRTVSMRMAGASFGAPGGL